tara:strand:- start:85 stop:318 length:234 start_codon:yes stop_codon:yes gene_type:complete
MSGLGYPGGRTGYAGMYQNDGFRGTTYGGMGYAGGRTGMMAQTNNDALRGFGAISAEKAVPIALVIGTLFVAYKLLK